MTGGSQTARRLRFGEYRVFYDVDEAGEIVFVRAVGRKDQGQTTEDVI